MYPKLEENIHQALMSDLEKQTLELAAGPLAKKFLYAERELISRLMRVRKRYVLV